MNLRYRTAPDEVYGQCCEQRSPVQSVGQFKITHAKPNAEA